MNVVPLPVFAVEHSETVLARWPDPLAALTDDERRRAKGFGFRQDRRDYLAAHLLVRECAAQIGGGRPADLTLAQRCPTCGSTGHGKPSLPGVPGVHVSLSRSRGRVAATAAHSPVGIDLERSDRRQLPDDALMATVLAPAETEIVRAAFDPSRAFLRYWVRKEALVKAGLLSLDGLADLDLSGLPLHLHEGSGRTRWGRWHLVDHLEDQVVASAVALTAWGAEPPPVG